MDEDIILAHDIIEDALECWETDTAWQTTQKMKLAKFFLHGVLDGSSNNERRIILRQLFKEAQERGIEE